MRRYPRRSAALVTASLAFGITAALAATPPPSTGGAQAIADLAQRAPTIVVGRCSSVESAWDSAHRVIHTTATYEVERWLKGDQPTAQVRVRLLGGTVGDITQTAVGGPTARAGERVLMFLSPENDDRFALVGWSFGKLGIEPGVQGHDTVVLDGRGEPNLLPHDPSGTRSSPSPDAEGPSTLPLDAIEDLLRGRATEEQGR